MCMEQLGADASPSARFCGDTCRQRAYRSGVVEGRSPAADAIAATLDALVRLQYAARVTPGNLGGHVEAVADDLLASLRERLPYVAELAVRTIDHAGST